MIEVRRLMAVGALLGAAAVLTCADVWGEPERDKALRAFHKGGENVKPAAEGAFARDLDRNRFAEAPLVVYQVEKDRLFGLQVKAKLPDAPARAKDYLVVVDTSASKAMGPLALAQKIVEELVKKLGPDDRLAVWTANLKAKDLSRGFKSGKALEGVVAELNKELPLGAVALKKALSEAVASFEVKESRQRAVVFLGDGKSIAEPLDAADRAELCAAMVKKQVAFFAVPLGLRPDSQNLHSLISGTGGKAVRHGLNERIDDEVVKGKVVQRGLVSRLVKDVAEPILYDVEFTLPATAKEVLPSKLPPLRRDAGTLVVGKLPGNAAVLSYKLSGTLAGKPVRADAEFKVPASDEEHFFLVGVHGQWKAAADRPALLPSDRALAYAHKQTQLALEDLLAKGELALEQNKLDAAAKLFEQARQFAPHSPRARGGLVLVEKMKTGKKSRSRTRSCANVSVRRMSSRASAAARNANACA